MPPQRIMIFSKDVKIDDIIGRLPLRSDSHYEPDNIFYLDTGTPAALIQDPTILETRLFIFQDRCGWCSSWLSRVKHRLGF